MEATVEAGREKATVFKALSFGLLRKQLIHLSSESNGLL